MDIGLGLGIQGYRARANAMNIGLGLGIQGYRPGLRQGI